MNSTVRISFVIFMMAWEQAMEELFFQKKHDHYMDADLDIPDEEDLEILEDFLEEDIELGFDDASHDPYPTEEEAFWALTGKF